MILIERRISTKINILNLVDPLFEECFMTALKAAQLFDDKI